MLKLEIANHRRRKTVNPPNQNAAYALIGMMVVLVIMDLAYYNKHFEGPQAALNNSMNDILEKEVSLER